jgi:hypothetical protein
MNLIGSRTTLILNVCALVVASVVWAEEVYVRQVGYSGLLDPIPALFCYSFFPAIVMLIIRNRTFSYCFLLLYVANAIQMALAVRSAYLTGPFHDLPGTIHNIWSLLFLLVSGICLGIYVAHALVRFAISAFSSGNKQA